MPALKQLTRRSFLCACGGASLALATLPPGANAATADGLSLGFSQYGMKSLAPGDALKTIAGIGYDSVELALLPGWPTEPKLLSPAQRKELCAQLGGRRLGLPALMENLNALADDRAHQLNLEKIRAAAQLAHDLAPDNPPVLETVLGGAPAQWDQVKDRLVERLKTWADAAAAAKIVLAGKPHVGGAVHTPEAALWVWRQVNSPAFKLVFDHSHYQLHGLALADTLKALLPQSVFIHVKDARGDAAKFEFLLPGEGTVDYAEYFRLVHAGGYRGAVMVEVSGQIFNKPGYDPVAAARKSYSVLSTARQKAGLGRRL